MVKVLVRSPLLLFFSAAVARVASYQLSSVESSYEVPKFGVHELVATGTSEVLTGILSSTGLFQVSMPPAFAQHRQEALRGLCGCEGNLRMLNKNDSVDTVELQDGTIRTTVASATAGTLMLPLDPQLESTCSAETVEAMESLRDDVDRVSAAVVGALERHAFPATGTPLLSDAYEKDYHTLKSVIQSANHLEHFHVYSKPATNSDLAGYSLDWHTDAGLFLVFVPGLDCRDPSVEDTSFWLQDQEKPVRFDPNAAVVMMGAGMQHWLHQSPDAVATVRATRHAVSLQAGQERAWYGKMHLVPEHAYIQTNTTLADIKSHLAYNHDSEEEGKLNQGISMGCGIEQEQGWDDTMELLPYTPQRRRLQHVGSPSECNNVTNMFCWMQCMDIPNHEQTEGFLSEGYSLYCLDPGILAQTGNRVSAAMEPCLIGHTHNAQCTASWQPTAPGVAGAVPLVALDQEDSDLPVSDPGYCYSATSMFMDGFHWTHESTTCVIYLFSSWTLSTRGQVFAAFLGTIFAGIGLEGIIFQRRHLQSKQFWSSASRWKRVAGSSVIYGAQLTMGYFLMLVVMTYSIPLFSSVIIGLMCGHVLFNAKDAVLSKPLRPAESRCKAATTVSCDSSSDEERVPACCKPPQEQCCDEIPEGITPCCQNTL